MSNIKLLGTGCPSPSYKRFGPSTLIQIGKKNYLFDAGSGVSQRLNQSNIKSSEVEALFITHMHSDHIIDIYQLYISGWHQGRIEPFKIIGPVGIRDFFETQLQAFQEELEGRKNWEARPNKLGLDYLILEIDKNYTFSNDEVKITPFEVDHKPVDPAYGFKIEFSEKGEDKKIIISGDTRKSKKLIKESLNANALVHEVFVSLEFDNKRMTKETIKNVSDYHTNPNEVGEVAAEANVEKLILTHFVPPVFDKSKLKAVVSEKYKGELIIGEDLLNIEI